MDNRQNVTTVPLPPVVKIRNLYVGEIETLGYTKGGKELRSGINKKEIKEGRVRVTKLSLEGDHIDKKEFHGGPERVVHQFPPEDYPLLHSFIRSHSQSDDVLDASLFHPGRFGENVTTDPGMNEKNVCVGDVYRVGYEEESEEDVILKVTQPRKPCYQLNHRFQFPKVSELSELACMTGWFYSVLREGEIKVGQSFYLKHRPTKQFSLHRIHELISNYQKNLDFTLAPDVKEELKELGVFEDLSLNWRIMAEKILNGEAKKFDPTIRLYGGENAFLHSPLSSPSSASGSHIGCCDLQQKLKEVATGSVFMLVILGLALVLQKRGV